MNNTNNNNKILDLEEIKQDAEKNITEFNNSVIKRIEDISKFKKNDLDKLLKMILDDCQDLSELESYTNILKTRIIENEELIDKYLYQKELTKEDIIDANIIKIYLLYNGAYLVTRLSSPDIYEFIKNFLITIFIGIATFNISLDHFTSEKHKKELEKNIINLNKMIEINEYDIYTFNRFRELYIKELTYEVTKLIEITKYNNEDDNYIRIKKFLDGLKIDFLLDEESVKAKTRRKYK